MSRVSGEQAESDALRYLIQQGLTLVERNFTAPFGEIDLILIESDSLVFVEVRMRKCSVYGDALESITVSKQNKLIKTAEHYLVRRHKYAKMVCRFDVVCIDNHKNIKWIRDAFGA